MYAGISTPSIPAQFWHQLSGSTPTSRFLIICTSYLMIPSSITWLFIKVNWFTNCIVKPLRAHRPIWVSRFIIIVICYLYFLGWFLPSTSHSSLWFQIFNFRPKKFTLVHSDENEMRNIELLFRQRERKPQYLGSTSTNDGIIISI